MCSACAGDYQDPDRTARPDGDLELDWWDYEYDQWSSLLPAIADDGPLPDPIKVAQIALGIGKPWRVTICELDGSLPTEHAFLTENAAEAFAWLANYGGKLRARVWNVGELYTLLPRS